MAQRRCLMILSVLSGEKSVEDASREAELSPAMYYQLERKALTAMLSALVPGASADGTPAPQLRQLEEKVAHLEKERRRSERLLFLTRQVVKSGPMTSGKRGRPRTRPDSKRTGPKHSLASRKPKKASSPTNSTPTLDGASEP
jgi:hypothetical protein